MTFGIDWPKSLKDGKAKILIDFMVRITAIGGIVAVDLYHLKKKIPDSRISMNLGHLTQQYCCIQTDVTVF